MAQFFGLVVLAILAAVHCAPTTSPHIPEKYLGTYETEPEKDHNVLEFINPQLGHSLYSSITGFRLPGEDGWGRPYVFYLYREGDYYLWSYVLAPNKPHYTIKFRLGEKRTFSFEGKTFEFEYTTEQRDGDLVFRGKFRDLDSDHKFTEEATFTEKGFTMTFTRDGATAVRSFRKIPSPTIFGLYQNVPERETSGLIGGVANTHFRLSPEIEWNSNTTFWIGKWEKDFIFEYHATSTAYWTLTFRPFEERTIQFNGQTISYKVDVLEHDYAKQQSRVKVTFKTPTGATVVVTYVFTPEGIEDTTEINGATYKRFYKCVTAYMTLGTYENVPELSTNVAEYNRAAGYPDDSQQRGRVTFHLKDGALYSRLTGENGKTYDMPFNLGQTTTFNGPLGPVTYLFNERPSYSNDVLITGSYEWSGKKTTVEMTFNPTGIKTVYRIGDVVATRFHRKVVPNVVFGTYEALPANDNAAYGQYITATNCAECAHKTTVEITEQPQGAYREAFTFDGPTRTTYSVDVTELGKFHPVNGRKVMHMLFSYDHPVVFELWTYDGPNGPLYYTAVREFTKTGFNVTYNVNGQYASRVYKRV